MPQRDSPLLLETRGRWRIPNELRPERPMIALAESIRILGDAFPDARLRSITATYNCMGLVVASRRTWVDPEHLIRILREDGFRRLGSAAEAEPGDVVAYHDPDGEICHVGIVVQKNLALPSTPTDPLKVLSKWGADGEYLHDMSRVPYLLGVAAEFWTDRRGV
ncbi:MAG TPA: hypothetical protein VKA46_22295 [Gemmataceae bacterium]|nr:hypothetical protein [Gemmataceae bacterium]